MVVSDFRIRFAGRWGVDPSVVDFLSFFDVSPPPPFSGVAGAKRSHSLGCPKLLLPYPTPYQCRGLATDPTWDVSYPKGSRDTCLK